MQPLNFECVDFDSFVGLPAAYSNIHSLYRTLDPDSEKEFCRGFATYLGIIFSIESAIVWGKYKLNIVTVSGDFYPRNTGIDYDTLFVWNGKEYENVAYPNYVIREKDLHKEE